MLLCCFVLDYFFLPLFLFFSVWLCFFLCLPLYLGFGGAEVVRFCCVVLCAAVDSNWFSANGIWCWAGGCAKLFGGGGVVAVVSGASGLLFRCFLIFCFCRFFGFV